MRVCGGGLGGWRLSVCGTQGVGMFTLLSGRHPKCANFAPNVSTVILLRFWARFCASPLTKLTHRQNIEFHLSVCLANAKHLVGFAVAPTWFHSGSKHGAKPFQHVGAAVPARSPRMINYWERVVDALVEAS